MNRSPRRTLTHGNQAEFDSLGVRLVNNWERSEGLRCFDGCENIPVSTQADLLIEDDDAMEVVEAADESQRRRQRC